MYYSIDYRILHKKISMTTYRIIKLKDGTFFRYKDGAVRRYYNRTKAEADANALGGIVLMTQQ